MDRSDVARVLGQIAAFLELRGEDQFRVRAYKAAARAVTSYPDDLRQALASGALTELKGIGPATLDIIDEILTGGRSHVLDELREQIPPGLVEMLQISGLGVAKIRQIHESLGIDSLAELEEAARSGRLAGLPRFGRKTAENILKGIDFLRHVGGHRLFHHARKEARALADVLSATPGVRRAEVAGSVRRCREIIRDLDFVVLLDGPPAPFFNRLATAPGVTQSIPAGDRRVTLRFQSGSVAEIHAASEPQFGFQFVRATGSEEHVAALAARARAHGLSWEDDGLAHDGMPLPTPTEESVYDALDLQWIPPELREATGEIEAAAAGTLPDLIRLEDLQGFLHCHTDYSDGSSRVSDWAASAAERGYTYLGITDHSQALTDAGGLLARDIARQHAEVDAVNRDFPHLRVLKGVEADILEDGSLDYTPQLRAGFEFIIASVHRHIILSTDEMTARVLTAMDDPTMTILGHPTGRLLLSRDPFPLDLERVFETAAERGIAVEINADPQRLDLDWRVLRQASAAGVTISVGADAHNTAGMANVEIGIGIARKGWLTAATVLNTRSADEFLAFARRRGP